MRCPDHCDEESPWMCECTKHSLDALRRMVETRDLLIADLHREIALLNSGLEMAIDAACSPSNMRKAVDGYMLKLRNNHD